ncbi:MAG: hypothetical protein EOP64_05375 [Sphingomonas sp.]|nr:MAG: hypothetical protein EOP64_05375 [Sphingomonas sp.]
MSFDFAVIEYVTDQLATRAPHVWQDSAAGTRSTLDLFVQHYVLLSADYAWIELGGRIPVNAVLIGRDFRFPEAQLFASTCGVLDTGATLVRPNGIVAWHLQVSPDAEGGSLYPPPYHCEVLTTNLRARNDVPGGSFINRSGFPGHEARFGKVCTG